MITVRCHKHCQATAEFATEGEAIRREWRLATAGTDETGIETVWFCPAAPLTHLSEFLEAKLARGTTARAAVIESRVRE